MVNTQPLRRGVSAGLAAAALMVIGVALPSGVADASTRSPWDGIAACESGGDWSIDTGNGYFGGLQFSPATWAAHGGRGSAADASRAEQIAVGRRVVASQGWEAWSSCSARLGLHGHSIPADRRSDHGRARPGRRAGSTASTGAAACTARVLEARFVDGGSAGGMRYGDLELTNTGSHRCRLGRASGALYLSAGGHDEQVGAPGTHDLTTHRLTTTASEQSHLVLRAHGGRAYRRITIASAADHDERCAPVHATALVTVLRGSPRRVRASLRGLHVRTCLDRGYRALSFGRYRPQPSTSRR